MLSDMASKQKISRKSTNTADLPKDITDFKSAFKYYKSKNPPPDFQTVIDLDKDCFTDHFHEIKSDKSEVSSEHCRPSSDWRIFKFKPVAGIIIIKNVLSGDDQYYWSSRCIKVKVSKESRLHMESF